ncbi:MAG: hypothetical protein AAGD05_04245 [Bacteroidota bacterium]
MKPYEFNLINAFVLIAMGLWGYFSSEDPSPTALIPVAFGALFAMLTPLFQKENKVVAHIIVLLTFLLILALLMPLKGAIGRGDTMATIRVGIMILSCSVAMFFYIKSFRDARKAREA